MRLVLWEMYKRMLASMTQKGPVLRRAKEKKNMVWGGWLWKGLEQTALPWVKVLRVKSGQVVMEEMGHISDFFSLVWIWCKGYFSLPLFIGRNTKFYIYIYLTVQVKWQPRQFPFSVPLEHNY